MRVVILTTTVAIGARTRVTAERGTATAREIASGEAAPIAFGAISLNTKRATVEKRTAAGTPYASPSHAVASSVASADAALLKRFWPIRIVARSLEVCAFRSRMIAP